MRPRSDDAKGHLRPQRKVDDMTGKQKRTEAERDGTSKMLHKRAVEEEVKWRAAHGIDAGLQTKNQKAKAKVEHRLPDRGEVRRRETRLQARIDRTLLARPLLVAVEDDGQQRLIKRER